MGEGCEGVRGEGACGEPRPSRCWRIVVPRSEEWLAIVTKRRSS